MLKNKIKLSKVEKSFLAGTDKDYLYEPEEKIATIMVENLPGLGKLTALRFIEWVQANPDGVISLPTGKTPEFFIKWVQKILGSWKDNETQKLLEESGLDPKTPPQMQSLNFVQIDEFYPINPNQHNSLYYYVKKFYIDGFGLDKDKALLINCDEIGLDRQHELTDIWPDYKVDLSLRIRPALNPQEELQKKVLEKVDQWCLEYEDKIRAMGGIGFFLGGIGPDGHIGFNVRGSDHHSTTRLMSINYETQAASASDLGGMEIAKNRQVITIGLGTIAYNNKCIALIIAAGDTKATVVADAISGEKGTTHPASVLQDLPNARFFLTRGAAKKLNERQFANFKQSEITDEDIERVVIDCSTKNGKRIMDLSQAEADRYPFFCEILKRNQRPLKQVLQNVHDSLIAKIKKGTVALGNTRFLHTEPHHDDIMLGYLPAAVRHIRDASNFHYFATFTSGFTAVTNQYMYERMGKLLAFLEKGVFEKLNEENYFDPKNMRKRNQDIWHYLNGVAAKSEHMQNEGISFRLLRDLIEIFDETDLQNIQDRIIELRHYFESEYPGKKDLPHIQRLKGMCREWEAECLWGYFGWNCENVRHLRLGFYQGEIFTEQPKIERDVTPIVKLLQDVKPDVVTVALDPEGAGPDTHYKVLQALSEALQIYADKHNRQDIRIWGYRNVWYRFHPSESNIYVPVSLNMFAVMENAFMNSFLSQKDAPFPSYELDGPFSELAQKIQIEQYHDLQTCIGDKWFYNHNSALIRATRGLVFLKEMNLQEFYAQSRKLKEVME